jgi:hypothetical protein
VNERISDIPGGLSFDRGSQVRILAGAPTFPRSEGIFGVPTKVSNDPEMAVVAHLWNTNFTPTLTGAS